MVPVLRFANGGDSSRDADDGRRTSTRTVANWQQSAEQLKI